MNEGIFGVETQRRVERVPLLLSCYEYDSSVILNGRIMVFNNNENLLITGLKRSEKWLRSFTGIYRLSGQCLYYNEKVESDTSAMLPACLSNNGALIVTEQGVYQFANDKLMLVDLSRCPVSGTGWELPGSVILDPRRHIFYRSVYNGRGYWYSVHGLGFGYTPGIEQLYVDVVRISGTNRSMIWRHAEWVTGLVNSVIIRLLHIDYVMSNF
ncbi:MAG TPA: hypothetical protein PKM88_06035 [bacterium]|nr:hypothetical protein [bacterium]